MTHCPHCHKPLNAPQGAAFCPFCGGALSCESPRENEQVASALLALAEEKNLRKKHDALLRLEAEYPDSLAVAEELLYMGQLYERDKRVGDFRVIKSYLLQPYLEPKAFKEALKSELRDELFHHPQLLRCVELAGTEDYLRVYLTRLSTDYIRLFLHGNSRYMRRIFGFGMERNAARYLAEPASVILGNIDKDAALREEQRTLLSHAFYAAFAQELGDTSYLDSFLGKA